MTMKQRASRERSFLLPLRMSFFFLPLRTALLLRAIL